MSSSLAVAGGGQGENAGSARESVSRGVQNAFKAPAQLQQEGRGAGRDGEGERPIASSPGGVTPRRRYVSGAEGVNDESRESGARERVEEREGEWEGGREGGMSAGDSGSLVHGVMGSSLVQHHRPASSHANSHAASSVGGGGGGRSGAGGAGATSAWSVRESALDRLDSRSKRARHSVRRASGASVRATSASHAGKSEFASASGSWAASRAVSVEEEERRLIKEL